MKIKIGEYSWRSERVWLNGLLLVWGQVFLVNGQPGSLDSAFVPQTPAYGTVTDMALQADGKLVFSSQVRSYPPTLTQVGRLLPNGAADTTFTNTFITNAGVLTLAADVEGRVLLGGQFLSVQDQPRQRIARLDASGLLDASFNPGGANSDIAVLTVQTNGQILAGGLFTSFKRAPRRGLARLNSDGSLDAGFNPSAGVDNTNSDAIHAIALLPDGRIVVAGNFTRFSGVPRARVAMLSSDGTLDAGFDPGGGPDGTVNAVAVQPDGKVVLGGEFVHVGGELRRRIARLNADGSLDVSFNPAPGISSGMVSPSTMSLKALALSADGRVYVGGSFGYVNGVLRPGLARLLPGGALDYDFAVEGVSASGGFGVQSIAVQPDGQVLVSGGFTSLSGMARHGVARFAGDGVNSAGRFEFSSAQYRLNEGAGTVLVTVKRTGGNLGAATVRYASSDGTATAPADYIPSSGTLSFGTGELEKTIAVSIVNDVVAEDEGCCSLYVDVIADDFVREEVFSMALSAPTGGGVLGSQSGALVVIEDDDTAFSFTSSSYTVGELDGRGSLRVQRIGYTDGTNTVTWATTGGTASAGLDYVVGSNAVVFLPGETTRDIRLTILEDELTEGNETVEVRLSEPTGSATLISPSTAALTIEDRPGVVVSTLPGAVDPSFFPGPWLDGKVYSLAVGSDGSSFARGYFYLSGTGPQYFAWLLPDGRLDESFHPPPSFNGSAVALHPDGRALVARERVLRLNANGSVDPTFDSASYGGWSVQVLTPQMDGRLIIAGDFTSVGGVSRQWIARLNEEGGLDISFDPGTGPGGGINPGPGLHTVALQNDGKVLVGGDFTTWGGASHAVLVRLNSSGSLDASFNPAVVGYINAVAIQEDGKVLIAGYSLGVNGAPAPGVVRLTSDGSVDSTFVPSSAIEDGSITAMALQDDGKIVIGFIIHNPLRYRVARLNANGSLDVTFDSGTGPDGMVNVMALQRDGGVLVGGEFGNFNGRPRRGLVRLIGGDPPPAAPYFKRQPASRVVQEGENVSLECSVLGFPIPSLQWTFNGQPVPGATTERLDLSNVATNQSGTYVLVAQNNLGTNASANAVLTVAPASMQPGRVDLSFHPGSGATKPMINFQACVTALAVDGFGRTLIGGNFSRINGLPCGGLARLLPDGSVDPAFLLGSGVDGGNINALALQPDGKAVVAGWFFELNGLARSTIARLNPDGSVDDSFDVGSGASYNIHSVIVQPDGRIVLAGDFSAFGGVARSGIARLNPDGSLENSFEPGSGGSQVSGYSAALQPDGKIVLGGYFSTIQGVPRNNLARFNSDGTLDVSFAPAVGISGTVLAVAVQADGKIVVAGNFSSSGGSRRGITRLLPDGSLDPSFNASLGPDAYVTTLLPQNLGRVILAGALTNFNNVSCPGIVRLLADGSMDPDFHVDFCPDGGVEALGLQADGRVLVGGSFTNFDGRPRSGIARLHNSSDSAAGGLEFSQPTASVWENGGTNLVLKVRRLGGVHGMVQANYAVGGGNSRPGIHYQPFGGTLAFGDGEEAEVSIPVTVINNQLAEGDRLLEVWLGTPWGGATLGGNAAIRVLIVEDDTALEFSKTRIQCPENQGMQPIAVRRLGRLEGVVTVDYLATNGTAQAGLDFVPQQGTLVFAPGATNQLFTVPILDDRRSEGDLTVDLVLTNASGGAFLTTNCAGILTILDNDRPGSFDPSFYPRLCSWPAAKHIAVQRDGRPVVVLEGATAFQPVEALVRFLPDGELDPDFVTPFGINVVDLGLEISTVVVLPDDRILLAGIRSSGFGWGGTNFVLRLLRDGQLDPTFNPPAFPWAYAVQVTGLLPLPNGQVVIGGSFQKINGSPQPCLVRINTDGTLDSGFHSAAWASNSLQEVHCLAPGPEGRVLMGGVFLCPTNSNDYSVRLARVNPDGSLDCAFDPGVTLLDDSGNPYGATVDSILCQPDFKFVVRGTFAQANGVARTNLARFNADGSLDLAFAPRFGATAQYGWNWRPRIALQSDLKLIIGGAFNQVNDLPYNGLVRLNADGSVDAEFNSSQDIADLVEPLYVRALALQPDGGILVGCDRYQLFDVDMRCCLVRINGTRTPAPRRISVVSQPPVGKTKLRFFAPPGTEYLVQASTNWNEWKTVGPAIELGRGVFEFEDSESTQLPWRFYRLLSGN